jgi:flagellin-specific chaperone FliS
MTSAPKNEPKWMARLLQHLKENSDNESFSRKCDTVFRKISRNWPAFKDICDQEKAAQPKKERKPRKPDPAKSIQKAVQDFGKAMEVMEDNDVQNAEQSIAEQFLQFPPQLVEKIMNGAVESGIVQPVSSDQSYDRKKKKRKRQEEQEPQTKNHEDVGEEWKNQILSRAHDLYQNLETKMVDLDGDEKEEIQQSVQQLYEIIQEMVSDSIE